MEEDGKAYSIYNNEKQGLFRPGKRKAKKIEKVLTKGEKGGILTKLPREGR